MDSYDCKVFKHGCPTGPYFGETVYKCEVLIKSKIYVVCLERNEFHIFCLSVNDVYKNKKDGKLHHYGIV